MAASIPWLRKDNLLGLRAVKRCLAVFKILCVLYHPASPGPLPWGRGECLAVPHEVGLRKSN